MESLCYSANKGTEDAYDVSTSLTGPERRDGMAPRNCRSLPKTQKKKKKNDDRKNSDDPLADHLEWLKEFKENLMDIELVASAHSSQETDLEHPVEVENFILTTRKTEIATSA